MKIALITPYASFPGGVESVNQILSNIFEEVGHSVDLITAENYQLNLRNRIMIKLVGLPYVTAMKFKSLSKTYDLVIANGEFGWGISHPRTINVFHGSYKGYRDYLKKQWSLKQFLGFSKAAFIQRFAAKGKYVVPVSEFLREILEDENITVHQVISNAVNIDKFKPNANIRKTKKCLFVGSYNYHAKGFDILEQLSCKGIELDCVTNVKPKFNLGWIKSTENKNMPNIYNQYSVLVFPSRFEGMGMVPLEAMACGLPIVMSNVGLGPELKQEIPEFVVDGYCVEEYFEKISFVRSNYIELSKKARLYVERHHSFLSYKKKWISLIERVMDA